MARAIVALGLMCLLCLSTAQQAGLHNPEVHPPITFATCTRVGGCTSVETTLTMDAQWRWLHDARRNQYSNCIHGVPPKWDRSICRDARKCAASCALEGLDTNAYKNTYGVSTVPGGIRLKFKNGESVGSRLYMMEDADTYKVFKLLNREFTFDVDVSTLECGLNGAVYFVEMQADGGMGSGNNAAGARYGTGYCDAQCPHDLKFISGEANLHDWQETNTGPQGHYGSCCAEMDIWEANFAATAFTTHACDSAGPLRCEGNTTMNTCGDTPEDCKCCGQEECPCCGRYKGVCDKDGCDYNSFRLGDEHFYGKGPNFAVDTSKPVTVVTQFLTSDGTDTGDLVEIRRLYVQDGKVIKNSQIANLEGFKGDSITDEMCVAQKKAFDNIDDFTKKGGLKAMGRSLRRGMVLVLSLWDDELTNMHWLDSATPLDQPVRYPLTKPGVRRGPCSTGSGKPHELRTMHPDAQVTYSNIKVGDIDSTYGKASENPSTSKPDTTGRPSVMTNPECCTAANNPSNPCDSCYVGAAMATGWCVEKEGHCTGNCGGTWCPNGITRFFDESSGARDGLHELRGHRSQLPFVAGVAMLVLPGLLLAALLRVSWPRNRPVDSRHLMVYDNLQQTDSVA